MTSKICYDFSETYSIGSGGKYLDIVDATKTRNVHNLRRFDVKCPWHYQLVDKQYQQFLRV